MKKLLCLVLVLVMALAMSSTAFAAGKLVVASETMTVYEAYSDNYYAHVFAILENTGDKPVEFNAGLIEILDPDGESLDAEDYLYCYPTILEPGQRGYLNEYVRFEDIDPETIDDYTLSVSGKSAKENYNVTLDCTAAASMEPYSYTSSTEYYTATINVTNNTDETVREIYAAYALLDADGNVMYCDYISTSYVGIPAGQTIELRKTIDSKLVDKWVADGVSPAAIEAVAYSKQGW